MDSKFQSKLHVLDTDDVKQKTSLFSVQGKSAWYVFMVICSFVLCLLCLVHKINADTPITAILSTYLRGSLSKSVSLDFGLEKLLPYIFIINTTIHPNNEIGVRIRKLFFFFSAIPSISLLDDRLAAKICKI